MNNPKTFSSDVTLRDYFAGQAMQALIMKELPSDPTQLPQCAFAMADAMLKARGEVEGGR